MFETGSFSSCFYLPDNYQLEIMLMSKAQPHMWTLPNIPTSIQWITWGSTGVRKADWIRNWGNDFLEFDFITSILVVWIPTKTWVLHSNLLLLLAQRISWLYLNSWKDPIFIWILFLQIKFNFYFKHSSDYFLNIYVYIYKFSLK